MMHRNFVKDSVRLAKFQAEPNDATVLAAQAEWRVADQSLFAAVWEHENAERESDGRFQFYN